MNSTSKQGLNAASRRALQFVDLHDEELGFYLVAIFLSHFKTLKINHWTLSALSLVRSLNSLNFILLYAYSSSTSCIISRRLHSPSVDLA